MIEAGRSGKVVTKVKKMPVSSAGCMLPKRVVSEVQKRVPFDFNMGLHTRLWKHFELHPARWVAPDGGDRVRVLHSRRTHPAIRLHPRVGRQDLKEIGTPERFEAFFGSPPRMGKMTQIATAPSKQEQVKDGG